MVVSHSRNLRNPFRIACYPFHCNAILKITTSDAYMIDII